MSAMNSSFWPSPEELSALGSLFTPSDKPSDTMLNNSSPTDFAFGPPIDEYTAKPSYLQSTTYSHLPIMQQYDLSSTSSFSSASGSITGSSFSSNDALPAISRDFAKPPTDTRRPATAGGVLQSRSPFVGYMPAGKAVETIEENAESLFSNPFTQPLEKPQTMAIDPHSISRRSSDPPTSWGTMNPPPLPNYNIPQRIDYTSRPQTSDGLPSYSGMNGVSLPPARTIVPDLPQSNTYYRTPSTILPPRESLGHNTFPGNRAYSLDSSARSGIAESAHSDMQFVALGGPTPKKRPRRRFDEIERLYLCGYAGCEKSYGTLNHLNAHVAMQKHGEKRLPSEFKDMRKAWRKKKRGQTAAQANHASDPQWSGGRRSISSSSDSDERRDSTTSQLSSNRGSVSYPQNYTWNVDNRPSTSSSTASYNEQYIHPSIINQPLRRPSAPAYLPMPQGSIQGFRPQDGDHPTPTQTNPYPIPGAYGIRPQQYSNPAAQMGGNYPFQVLTSSAPFGGAQSFGQQFAFQR